MHKICNRLLLLNSGLYLSVSGNSAAYPKAEGTHICNVDQRQGYRKSQQVVTAHIDDGHVKLFPTTTKYATKQSLYNKIYQQKTDKELHICYWGNVSIINSVII